MSRLGRGYPNNVLMHLAPTAPVSYDAKGTAAAAGGSTAETLTWTHIITGNAVVTCLDLESSLSTTAATAKIGTTAMTKLGTSPQMTNSGFYFQIVWFGLLNPPTGNQTLTVTMDSGTNYCAAESISYNNVNTFGPITSSSGSGSAPTLSVPSGRGQMIAEAFATWTTAPSAYTQTVRYTLNSTSTARPVIVGDAPGAATVNFSAASCDQWTAAAVPLQPI